MADVRDYSTTAASNTDDAPEGMQAGGLNDAIRKVQADIAKLRDDMRGTITTGGTTSAYTLTLTTTPASLADGLFFSATVNAANAAGPVTLTVTPSGGSAFSSKKIRKISGGSERDLSAGDLSANGHYLFQYDSAADSGTGAYIVLNPEPPGWRLIERQVVSGAVSNVDFTSGLNDTYDEYELRLTGLVPSSDGANLIFLIGTGAGPTWATGPGAYSWALEYLTTGGSSVVVADTSDTQIQLTGNGVGSAAGEHVSSVVKFDNPDSSSLYFQINYETRAINLSGNSNPTKGGGMYTATTAVTGLRVMFFTGNVASGVLALYGLAK